MRELAFVPWMDKHASRAQLLSSDHNHRHLGVGIAEFDSQDKLEELIDDHLGCVAPPISRDSLLRGLTGERRSTVGGGFCEGLLTFF